MKLPTVSIVFLSYKQERFVEEALRAALAQDLPEFELVIADDASPDDTWGVIERILAEPIRPGIHVKTLRQPKNLGILGNFNAALAMTAGEILVVMAGDDVSYPPRARRMAEVFAADSSLRAVSCACRVIDGSGATVTARPPDVVARTFEHGRGRKDPFAGAPVNGACASYHRSLFDVFGPLSPDAGGEDIDFIFRALLVGRVMYTGEPLVDYRIHGGNAFNYAQQAYSDEDYLRKEIHFAEAISRCDRQWLRDMTSAQAKGLIDSGQARAISRAVDRYVARHKLFALSLGVAPMADWWFVAKRLIFLGDITKVVKLFGLRVFPARRTAHLEWTKKRRGS